MQDMALYLDRKTAQKGLLGILIAAIGQGTIPLYWILLSAVTAETAICYRAIFGFVFMCLFLLLRNVRREFLQDIRLKENWIYIGFASSVNFFVWFLLVWGAQNGFVLELGFGQFVQPLFCALMGMILFKQTLGHLKAIALIIVFIGVGCMFFIYGSFPWLALLVGFFSAYYLVLRKQAPAGCISGLIFENFYNSLMAIPLLLFIGAESVNMFMPSTLHLIILLFGAGCITSITQIIFVYGVQRSTMLTMGFTGYLSPIITVFVGVVFCNEAVSVDKIFGFCCIGLALVLVFIDTVRTAETVSDK